MSYKKYIDEYKENQIYDDTIHSTDEIMYSNTRMLDLYGQGKRLKIEDNIINYEVVKIVREIVDKHFYQFPIQFFIQVANKEVMFTFLIEKIYVNYNCFIETLYMFIKTYIYRQYGDKLEVIREDENVNNFLKMRIIVRHNDEME